MRVVKVVARIACPHDTCGNLSGVRSISAVTRTVGAKTWETRRGSRCVIDAGMVRGLRSVGGLLVPGRSVGGSILVWFFLLRWIRYSVLPGVGVPSLCRGYSS